MARYVYTIEVDAEAFDDLTEPWSPQEWMVESALATRLSIHPTQVHVTRRDAQ